MTHVYFMLVTVLMTYTLNAAFVCLRGKSPNREAYFFYLSVAYLVYIIITVFRPLGPGLGGTDTWGYRNYFVNATGSLAQGLSGQFYERGYAIFVWFIRQFTDEYRVLLFIVHSFIFGSIVSFMKTIRFNKYSFITILACVFLALNSINIVRIIVAVAMSMHVYALLKKDRLVLALGLIMLASTIHISVIIMFAVLFVYIVKRFEAHFSIDRMLLLTVVFLVGSFLFINIVSSIINQTKYVFYDADEGIAFPTYVMFLGVSLIGFIKYKALVKEDPLNDLLVYLLPLGLVILPLQFRYAIMYRMLLFIHPILYTLIPSLLLVNNQNKDASKNLRRLVINVILVGFVVYRIFSFFTAEIVDLGSFWGMYTASIY